MSRVHLKFHKDFEAPSNPVTCIYKTLLCMYLEEEVEATNSRTHLKYPKDFKKIYDYT